MIKTRYEKIKKCDNDCGNYAINEIILNHDAKIMICDECLQELNRKIVEHLAEKNI